MSAPVHPAEQWVPPTGDEVEMVVAGRYWDAVKVGSVPVGEAALTCLRHRSGAVIADHFGGAMYWLVRCGAATAWPALPTVTFLTATPDRVCLVGVPPVSRRVRPLPHWRVPLGPSCYLTDPAALFTALCTATRTVLEHP
ncbi:hypothetical protein GCM10027168_37220 [Streptomyces capparidis]